jgi:hypothetical protein
MNRIVLVNMLAILFFSAGCNKKPRETVPDSEPPPGKISTGRSNTPSTGGESTGGTPSGGAPRGSTKLGGVVGGVRGAARRTEALNEMRTLGQVISLLQNDLGRMPTKDQVVTELKAYPKLLEAVNQGAFILTGTTEAGGLWAYEVDADTIPGIALIGGTAMRSKPEELKQYFRGN